jgi:hypothetical protein
MSLLQSSPVTLSNPASCASLLMSSTVSFTGSNPVKSCINPGRSLHHTPFKQLTDTSSQAVLLLLMPVKMSNECPDRFVWPIQNSHHFHEGLAEVIDFKGCYYLLIHWLKKWCGVSWYVDNTDIQQCSDCRKDCRMARGLVQAKTRPLLVTYSVARNGAQRAKIVYVPIQEDSTLIGLDGSWG